MPTRKKLAQAMGKLIDVSQLPACITIDVTVMARITAAISLKMGPNVIVFSTRRQFSAPLLQYLAEGPQCAQNPLILAADFCSPQVNGSRRGPVDQGCLFFQPGQEFPGSQQHRVAAD
jgi:hypothetical protein